MKEVTYAREMDWLDHVVAQQGAEYKEAVKRAKERDERELAEYFNDCRTLNHDYA